MSDADTPSESRPGSQSRPSTTRESPVADATAFERLKPPTLVAIGGFIGAVARYAVSLALPVGFPWGTLTVNVAGSFALSVLVFEARLSGRLGAKTRLLLGTGLLSSFTTYSTFAVETASLTPTLAVANVGANYALGFVAVLAGRFVVRRGVSQ